MNKRWNTIIASTCCVIMIGLTTGCTKSETSNDSKIAENKQIAQNTKETGEKLDLSLQVNPEQPSSTKPMGWTVTVKENGKNVTDATVKVDFKGKHITMTNMVASHTKDGDYVQSPITFGTPGEYELVVKVTTAKGIHQEMKSKVAIS